MDKKKADQQASPKHSDIENITAAAQRQRLLARLERGPVDTLTARRELNILHPAGRIDELRRQGYGITTHRITLVDDHGRRHVGIALYVLRPTTSAQVAA